MNTFTPKFTITHRMTAAITRIERARSRPPMMDDWIVFGLLPAALENNHLEVMTKVQETKLPREALKNDR